MMPTISLEPFGDAERWRPWLTEDVALAPYPERAWPDEGVWDRTARRLASGFKAGLRRQSRPWAIVRATARHASRLAALHETGFRESATRLRPALQRAGFRLDLAGAAFAHVQEATRRHLGFSHHPVQLLGGYIMLRGGLAEMQTGEGKTITALLPAATAALAGMPVHIVTVNDYLAQRDADALAPIYAMLGLSVGVVQHGQDPPVRRAAYEADVTYCTNKELAFDYLKDKTASRGAGSRRRAGARRVFGEAGGQAPLLLRGLHFAIVDEADSILIDEARTPLILSAPIDTSAEADLYGEALALATQLEAGRDYVLVARQKQVYLTALGRERSSVLGERQGGIWRARRAREELLTQALSALHVFQRDHHYIVVDGAVQIVDEFTGRVMADRKWQRGLQQLIESKEGCERSDGRETLAQISYQRLFRRYLRLSGMSGTARERRSELASVYGLEVVTVPTHHPPQRRHVATRIHRTAAARWRDVVESCRREVQCGRPVLIGTRSVAASEEVFSRLAAAGIPAVVLNARQDAHEAEAIAAAGLAGQVTVATNIAGRGTDIRPSDAVIARGGLHVILTEFHESRRIDRQLIGRTGRQGDPGSYEEIVALDDELFRTFGGQVTALVRRIWPGAHIPPALGHALRAAAQARAERAHVRIRAQTMRRGREQDRALAFVNWSE